MSVATAEGRICGGFKEVGFGKKSLEGEVFLEIGGFGGVVIFDCGTDFIFQKRYLRGAGRRF